MKGPLEGAPDELDTDIPRNVRMRVVTGEREVRERESEDITHVGIENDLRQGTRLARQLKLHLLHVIQVYVYVFESMNELSRMQPSDLSQHEQKK